MELKAKPNWNRKTKLKLSKKLKACKDINLKIRGYLGVI